MLSKHYSPAAPRDASDLHPPLAGGPPGLCADLPLGSAGDACRPPAVAPPLMVQTKMRFQLQPTCPPATCPQRLTDSDVCLVSTQTNPDREVLALQITGQDYLGSPFGYFTALLCWDSLSGCWPWVPEPLRSLPAPVCPHAGVERPSTPSPEIVTLLFLDHGSQIFLFSLLISVSRTPSVSAFVGMLSPSTFWNMPKLWAGRLRKEGVRESRDVGKRGSWGG